MYHEEEKVPLARLDLQGFTGRHKTAPNRELPALILDVKLLARHEWPLARFQYLFSQRVNASVDP